MKKKNVYILEPGDVYQSPLNISMNSAFYNFQCPFVWQNTKHTHTIIKVLWAYFYNNGNKVIRNWPIQI